MSIAPSLRREAPNPASVGGCARPVYNLMQAQVLIEVANLQQSQFLLAAITLNGLPQRWLNSCKSNMIG